jgi:hypothetical protein
MGPAVRVPDPTLKEIYGGINSSAVDLPVDLSSSECTGGEGKENREIYPKLHKVVLTTHANRRRRSISWEMYIERTESGPAVVDPTNDSAAGRARQEFRRDIAWKAT